MDTSDWVRLALLVGLGLVSAGFVRWLGRTFAAVVLALLFHLQEGATWPGSVQAALAVAYLLPLFRVLTNIPFALVVMLVIGVPSLLVSHYSCESSWTMACADAFALTLLMPVSIIRCLVWMEVIEPPEEKVSTPSPTYYGPSSSSGSYSSDTQGGGAGFGVAKREEPPRLGR